MIRRLLIALGIALPGLTGYALDIKPGLPLWPDGAPGALGKTEFDFPTITPYLPDPAKATGAAFIVCPGGGYSKLAPHEGDPFARWLADLGIAAFVLKYRLGSHGYRHPAMMQDGLRAIRYVRANAAQWKLDPKRIGIIGASAGGHLASTVLTHFDAGNPAATDPIERVSSRPDLGILCYAVISMGLASHAGSRMNLLGPDPSEEQINELSNEKHVTSETAPCFIWQTWEDKTVDMKNAMLFAAALREKNVPFDLHIYEKGEHGLGLGSRDYDPAKFHPWVSDCTFWLRQHGWCR